MALADLTYLKRRFNRLLFLTASYTDLLSSPPLRRSFNSDQEITDVLLEADENVCLLIRNTIGHPFAPTFFTLSSALVNGDKVPASDAPIHRVTWSTTSNGTYADSEESDKADIVAANADYTLFGAAVTDIYGYHNIVAQQLYTTSPFVKVTQAPWTRTSACQAPQSYTSAILMNAITLAPKEGLNEDLLRFAAGKWAEFVPQIVGGAPLLPEITQYGLQEEAPN